MPGAVTIRTQTLGGTWEVFGVDRARGVWPENVQPQSDEHGPTTCSFDLRRDNRFEWPDLSAFTPVEVEIDGVIIWDGRVKETPTRDGRDGRIISVQCEGWQYHLDDDLYRRVYVHNDLSQWVDTRTLSACELTAFTIGGVVTPGGGLCSIGWPQGTVLGTTFHVGISVDLGEGSYAKGISIELDRINGGASITTVIRGHSVPSANPPAGQYEDPYVSTMSGSVTTPGTPLTITTSFTGAWRWVTFLMYGSSLTTSNDVSMIIRSVRVVADTNYNSVLGSILKAPVVIADALDRGTVLMTGARSIDPNGTATFNIPALAPADPRTPREYINGVNAYHDYLWRVDTGRRFSWLPRPSAPLLEVGEWSAMEFQDASANSGESIYNRVLASASGADGAPLLKSRTRQSGTDLLDTVNATIPNPTAQTDALNWTAIACTFARDTTNFHSAPAGFSISSTTARPEVDTTLTGPFNAGTPYVLQLAIRCAAQPVTASLGFGVFAGTQDYTAYEFPLTTSYQVVRLLWNPAQTFFNAEVHVGSPKIGALNAIYFDSLSIGTVRPTLVDRRGFRRTFQLQVAATMPQDGIAIGQIADVWLQAHRTTPFKGSLTVTGDSSVRDISSGRFVPAAQLIGMTGQRIRLADRIDPDTGGFGRDGQIAAVSYDPVQNTASLTLDDSRDNLSALLSRLAVIQGGS